MSEVESPPPAREVGSYRCVVRHSDGDYLGHDGSWTADPALARKFLCPGEAWSHLDGRWPEWVPRWLENGRVVTVPA